MARRSLQQNAVHKCARVADVSGNTEPSMHVTSVQAQTCMCQQCRRMCLAGSLKSTKQSEFAQGLRKCCM
jgi:hypothetical protein